MRRLLETEDQLKIANEQITNLKKKLAEAERAKNVAEWARDEASTQACLRASFQTWEQ